MVAEEALAGHLEHPLGLQVEAADRQRADDVDGRELALDDRIAGPGRLVGLVLGHVETAVRRHHTLELVVGERHQVELVQDGTAGLRGAPAQRQQGRVVLGSQRTLEAPIALHHQVVVDVLRVEVRGTEGVVVARNRAEAAEQEVRPGQEQRQRVRGAADVRRAHLGVVARARLEPVEGRHHVLGEDLAHAVGDGAGDVDAVDAAVLRALRAGGAGHGHAARLEVEQRLALRRAHQDLGARARCKTHLEAARGVRGGEQRLRPRCVIAVEEDPLGAVDRDGLGVGRESAQAELELRLLFDRALREGAGSRDLAADQESEGDQRRVAEDGHRGLELAEAERHRARRVGGDQQWVVDAIRHVRLNRRRAPGAHLRHRLHQLERTQQAEYPSDLGRRHALDEPQDLGARRLVPADHAREGEVVDRHRLLGHGHVDAVGGEEGIDQVEVGLLHAIELDDAPGFDADRRRRVVGTVEGDQAQLRVLGHDHVTADRLRRGERASLGFPGGGCHGAIVPGSAAVNRAAPAW